MLNIICFGVMSLCEDEQLDFKITAMIIIIIIIIIKPDQNSSKYIGLLFNVC